MKRITVSAIFQFCCLFVFCQQKITGIVIDNESGQPVPFASVISERGQGIITDSAGVFSFSVRRLSRLNDSLMITAIGYEKKKIAVKELIRNNKIRLFHADKMLENVNVKVFSSLKGDFRKFGYYRGWAAQNEGGEIGYVFNLPNTKFQLGSVQVKINHNYDTCWLKLHLRDVSASGLGLPENEVLKKEVIMPVTTRYGLVEFDMNWQEIQIPTHKLYVGFELLKCGCSESAAPSFFFMGNELGQNYFRERESAVWKSGGDYTIYIRMFTK